MIPIAKPLIGKEEKNEVTKVLDSGILAYGPKTQEFEEKFASYINTKYAMATTSGTTGLHLALLALGISKGDEVIVPAFSFIASANAVLFCGATPVFCDVDSKTCNITPQQIKDLVSDKTKAIMPVHLYGQSADMHPIQEIAEEHNLCVIGDAAQAHGAEYNGKRVGSFGDLECFSFYPTKNMTTGEGGAVTTNNSELYEKMLSLRNHGRAKTLWGYEHTCLGYNYRMTDLAAAIGIVQLGKLPQFIKKRQQNAEFYNSHLKNVVTPFVMDNAMHVYHQYTIKSNNRSQLISALKKNEIGFGIYYPKPLHFYPHLKLHGHKNLKNAEDLSEVVLSIPVHPSLSENDLQKIVDVVNGVYQFHGR